ncbi:MAG: hypothetical protein AMS16_05450 [Planctomycetes bacterium DG_58]|nr:MAG: hypothetical protein AMS16_05450 [Planctomycetes bacterium DG_58]
MLKRHYAVAVAVLVVWVFVCGGRAPADEILAEFDVFSVSGSWYGAVLYDGAEWMAQTFEAAATGTATSVDLVLESLPGNNPDNLPLRIELRTTYTDGYNGIVPSDNVIAQGSIAHDDSRFTGAYEWINIELTPAELNVGEMYAVVIKTDEQTDDAYEWKSKWKSGVDFYPPGRQVILLTGDQWNFSGDLAFRVRGTVVPEPATMVLVSLGGAGLLLRRRRRT